MDEAQISRLVRSIIREEMTPLLMGRVLSTDPVTFRSSTRRFPSEPEIPNLRSIHPFGFASHAPKGTECLIAPIAGDPTHLNVLGHHDTGRPALQEGECALYRPGAQSITAKADGSIRQGSPSASEPVVLGNVLVTFMATVLAKVEAALDAIATGPVGVTSAPGAPAPTHPALAAQLESLKADLQSLKTEYLDTAGTNIVGQKNFVQRT